MIKLIIISVAWWLVGLIGGFLLAKKMYFDSFYVEEINFPEGVTNEEEFKELLDNLLNEIEEELKNRKGK